MSESGRQASGVARKYPVEEGERFAQSPITGNLYRVTKWENRGEGRITAIHKEEVSIEDVPEEILCDNCENGIAVEQTEPGMAMCRGCYDAL